MSDTVIMGVDTKDLDEDLQDVQLFIGGREFQLGNLSSLDDASLCQALVDNRSELLRELDDPRRFAHDEPVIEFVIRTRKQVSVLTWMISRAILSRSSCSSDTPA